jgi:hypothetical protein
MPRLLASTITLLFTILFAGSASAALVDWHGTLESKLAAARRFEQSGAHMGLRGSGVATVNGSGGGVFHTLRLKGGITGSDYNPVTDPDTSGTIPVIGASGTLGTGTLSDLQNPPLSNNILTIKGFSRICLFTPACSNTSPRLDIPYVVDASNAIGIGGLLTAGGNGSIRISLEAGPWTIGSGAAVNQTQKGGFKTVTATGFSHGAGSGAVSTAGTGVIQLISPMQATTINAGANNELQSLFSILTLHFVPEPGFLLLLGAGVVGLGILGRNRLRD